MAQKKDEGLNGNEKIEQAVAALQQEIAQLHQKNADLQARSTAYETSLESVFSSKSWKLTAPIRSLMRLFHRGN